MMITRTLGLSVVVVGAIVFAVERVRERDHALGLDEAVVGLQFVGAASPGVSATDRANLYYDTTSDTVKMSLNAAAFTDVTTGGSSPSFANATIITALDVQSVIRNTASASLDVDETGIRCSANCALLTQGNGSASLNASSGTGAAILTPGTSGRVELNTVTVTALAATLCDAAAEVGHSYLVSANAAADITICICGKVGGAFAFHPTSAAGDCVP